MSSDFLEFFFKILLITDVSMNLFKFCLLILKIIMEYFAYWHVDDVLVYFLKNNAFVNYNIIVNSKQTLEQVQKYYYTILTGSNL